MRIESVQELQVTVRSRASDLGLERVMFGGPLGMDASDRPQGLNVSVGIAVTPRPNDYQLALRLRANTRQYRNFAEEVRALAKGEADIRFTGPVRVIAGCPGGTPLLAPLGIGASIGHAGVPGGTLGFFARRLKDGRIGVVSNNHVIANEDIGRDKDRVLHPSVCDGLGGKSRTVGRLAGNYPRLKKGTFKNVDCAFAVLVDGVTFDPSLLDDGTRLGKQTVAATNDMEVFKIGRTTRRTAGRIRAFAFDRVEVKDYHFGSVVFRKQIEIEASTTRTFSDPGDSGSLVFDAQNRPVALLFAETASGGAHGLGLHYANPIDDVLRALRVEIVV